MVDYGGVWYNNNWYGSYVTFTGISFESRKDPDTGEVKIICDISLPGFGKLNQFSGGLLRADGPTASIDLTDKNGPVRHSDGTGVSLSPWVWNLAMGRFDGEPGRPASLHFSFKFSPNSDDLAADRKPQNVVSPELTSLPSREAPGCAGRVHCANAGPDVARDRSAMQGRVSRQGPMLGQDRSFAELYGTSARAGMGTEAATSMPIAAQRNNAILNAVSHEAMRYEREAGRVMVAGA